MTSAQVFKTSVTNDSSFQNYPHPDDHTIRTNDYFPLINGLKFEVLNSTNGVKHSFLVIYRKQSRSILSFITELEHILYNHDIDVVLEGGE